MFQTAYQQITPPERSFVDWLVHEIAEAARRLGRRISEALHRPIPDTLTKHDTQGFLQRPLVRAAITERINALAEAEEISPQSWIKRIHSIAHANMGDYIKMDEFGDPYMDIANLSREQMGAIAQVELEKVETGTMSRTGKVKVKIKLHDAIAALKMEAAYMGLDDGENPHRRADKAAQTAPLPLTATPEQAADAYAAMIGE